MFGSDLAGQVERSGAESPAKTRVVMGAETISETSRARPAFPKGRWTLPENPFRSSYTPKTKRARGVQAELSLDNVKPVRNDLSDSDLELVPLEPAAPTQEKLPIADGGEAFRMASVWVRLKTRLFGDRTR